MIEYNPKLLALSGTNCKRRQPQQQSWSRHLCSVNHSSIWYVNVCNMIWRELGFFAVNSESIQQLCFALQVYHDDLQFPVKVRVLFG